MTVWITGAISRLSIGLFLARVALEVVGRPLPPAIILVMGGTAIAAALAWGRRAVRRDDLWPALLLLAYVLWPRRDLLVALGIATLTGIAWVLSLADAVSLPEWIGRLMDGALFLIAFLVYLTTAAPDVLPADAGEFQLVAVRLGVAHPPGFPLYTLVGHLFVRLLPWGTPAQRLNWMSGLLAAATLVLVARATRLWARRLGASPTIALACGWAAALTLGGATTFWAQATIANIRTPTALCAALALYALARFAAASTVRQANRALVILGLALGLGLGHHPSLAFPGLFFVVYVVLTDPRLALQPRRWWRPALAGLVGLLPLAYLPIRGAMGAPLAPPGLSTWHGFLRHILARGFAGDMFAYANPTDLPHRLALLPTLFPFQFNYLILALAALGLLTLLWRDRRLFVLLTGSLILHTLVTITYRAPQTVEYLMPAYLPVAIAVGLLPCSWIARSSRSFIPPFLCSLALWAGLLNGWAHAPSFVELADDYTTRQTVAPLLEQAPANALILADWHWVTPLWYLQQVEGLRPDVEVRYVYNVAGEEYRNTWRRRVRAVSPERPLLLTHFYEFGGYTTEPWGAGFLLRPRPVTKPMPPLISAEVTFGGAIQLLGYGLQPTSLHPGETVEFTLAWQALRPLEHLPSFTLRLAGDWNDRLAQTDRMLSTDITPGEVRFERLILPLYPTLVPGRYRVTLGAYTTTKAGFETLPTTEGETAVTLTELELTPLSRPPFTLHRQTVPFAGGLTLVGVDYDRSIPDVLRIYLHWQGPAEAGLQVQVRTTERVETATPMPPMPSSTYQTIVVDMAGPVAGPLWLTLTDEQGKVRTASGPWAWPMLHVPLPAPAPDARFVPIGGDMVLVDARAHPAAPGDVMAIDLTLMALRPLTSDDATSVRLMDTDGRWLARHDMQPALGAIPTLKWIRSSRVVDRHLLLVPDDFTGKQVQAALVVYERFRGVTLPPLDGRFGNVPLGTWTVP